MGQYEMNVEFGICPFQKEKIEAKDEEVWDESSQEIPYLQAEDIRTGNLYFDEHQPKTKHIPFILTSYAVNVSHVMNIFLEKWCLPSPKIVLLAVASSPDSPSAQYQNLSNKLVKGLVHALNTTEMWLCTDGLDRGFGKHIATEFKSEVSRRKTIEPTYQKEHVSMYPETALIGICKTDDLSFSEKLESENRFSEGNFAASKEKESKQDVNNHCGYFIFIKDNTKFKNGISQFTLNFADYLRKNLPFTRRAEAVIKTTRFAIRICETPVITLLMHGNVSDLNFILEQLKNGLPLVVFEGSGGLADLIAFAHYQSTCKPEGIDVAEYTEAVLKPQIQERINRTYPNLSEWHITERIFTEKIFACIRYSKQEEQEFLTVINVGDIEYNPAHLPSHLLRALFKSQATDKIRSAHQMKKDLFLAMDWNSPDVAMAEVFARDPTNKFRIDNDTFFRALTKHHREDFVSLFLKQGFVLHTFLDSVMLLNLFHSSLNREFFRGIVWESVLGLGSSVEITRNFIDGKLIMLLEELTGVPSLINTYELDWNSRQMYDDGTPAEAERKAVAVLTIWAVLSYRINLVKAIWKHSEQPIHLALTCSVILRRLEAYVTDLSLRHEMHKKSKEFSQMAADIMTKCYESVSCRAIDLLCEENRVWSYKSVVEIAAYARNRTFLSHPSVQKHLDNLFMGNIKIRDLPYGDVTIPRWLKIILSAFFFFPTYLWIRFEESDLKKHAKRKDILEKSARYVYTHSSSPKELQMPASVSSGKDKKTMNPWIWKKIYYLYSAPIVKFWVSQVFYLIFLFFFSLAVIWPACGSLYLDLIACIWIAIIIVDSTYHAYTLNQKYASLPLAYKCIEILLLLMFLLAYVISRLFYYQLYMSPYSAKIMLCVALLYFYYRLIFVALPISPELGPMLYRVTRMVVVDFYGFIRVAGLVIISNAIIMHVTIYPDHPLGYDMARRAFYDALISLFLTPAQHFGIADPKCVQLMRHPSKPTFLGLPSDVCKVGRYFLYTCPNPGIWPYIFGLQYLIILRLILLVLLFALFSNTHNKLQAEGTYIWKYQRYELVVNFCNRIILPPPLCIFSYIFILLKAIFRGICRLESKKKDDDSNLDERDFMYWKTLASEYRDDKVEAETSTAKRMEMVNALEQALKQQQENLRDLRGHLTELQIRIVNTHQCLEAAGLSVSVREKLEMPYIPQIFSRTSPYPGTKISRFPVSDSHVPWSCKWSIYDPIAYTMPKEDFPVRMQERVDTDIQLRRELGGQEFAMPTFSWNIISVSPAGVYVDRTTWITKGKRDEAIRYAIDEEGLPVNPMGRTGLRGRGRLPRWGPNHYIYVIITRWVKDPEVTHHKYLEIVLILSEYDVSLPGGLIYTENIYKPIFTLFEGEGPWLEQEDMTAFFQSFSQEDAGRKLDKKSSKEILLSRLPKILSDDAAPTEMSDYQKSSETEHQREEKPKRTRLVSQTGSHLLSDVIVDSQYCRCEKIKKGYLDEETNTDQAWCEAEVWHIHYKKGCTIEENFQSNMFWVLLNENILVKVPVGHAALMNAVAKKLEAIIQVL